jgi:hypothetical protein
VSILKFFRNPARSRPSKRQRYVPTLDNLERRQLLAYEAIRWSHAYDYHEIVADTHIEVTIGTAALAIMMGRWSSTPSR